MNLDGLKDKVKEVIGDNFKNIEKKSELVRLQNYDGEDRVISSKEAKVIAAENAGSAGIFTRLSKLDEIIGGFRHGQLVVLSAPTGQGKTQFLQSLTYDFAEQDVNSLWFSYEVGLEEFLARFGGEVPAFYLPRKIKGSSMEWLREKIYEGIAKYRTEVVFVDHLHFLLEMGDLANAKSTSILIGMLMRELKKLAIETNTIIFLVAHMKKNQLDQVPSIDDLRDSSFVAQEADLVMMMWRHRIKDKESPTGYTDTNESRVLVEKNRRSGKKGYVKLILENGRFRELSLFDGHTN